MQEPRSRPNFLSCLRRELPYLLESLDPGQGFFHQPEQFHFLGQILADHLRHHVEPPSRFLVVGCDQGLDGYSLALTCLEAARDQGTFDFSIVATDFLPENIQVARRGVYPIQSLERVPRALLARYFLRGRTNQDKARLQPGVRASVHFRCQDIFEKFSLREPMDAIICRQLIHHFSQPLAQALVDRLRGYLAPGGLLVLGQKENLGPHWQQIGPAMYQMR